MSVWDDPDLKVNDDYVKFEQVGDRVAGRIITIRAHRFDDGKVVPQILLDTPDGERTLTAGQVRLKAELAEKRPEVGDHLEVELENIEKRAGGKTLKAFRVVVTRGGSGTPAATQPATATTPVTSAPPVTPPQLTPEQLEQLKAMGIQVPA